MQSVKPYVSINTLKMIYYFCFHSVMTYGLLFWGHSTAWYLIVSYIGVSVEEEYVASFFAVV